MLALPIDKQQCAAICRRHRIQKLAVFGSALRPDFHAASDVDLLVEFQPGATPGWEIVDIADEFSKIFGGRHVDLVNPKYILPRLRNSILESAEIFYEDSDAA